MKYLGLFCTMWLGLSSLGHAEIVDSELVTCKFSGKNLERHRLYGDRSFPNDAVAGEYVLFEEVDTEDSYKPSRLKVRKYYYDKDGARKSPVGNPLTRVGYSVFGEVVTISYSVFNYGDANDFHIVTDGKTAQISYTQGATYRNRGYQGSVDCKVHDHAVISVPALDMGKLTAEEQVNILDGMSYVRSMTVHNVEKAIGTKAVKTMKKQIVKLAADFDFAVSMPGYYNVEWKGCGKLKWEEGRYGSSRSVHDYEGNLLGYHFADFECSNKIKYLKKKFSSETGERVKDESHEEYVRISTIFLDAKGNVINLNLKEKGPRVRTSSW